MALTPSEIQAKSSRLAARHDVIYYLYVGNTLENISASVDTVNRYIETGADVAVYEANLLERHSHRIY